MDRIESLQVVNNVGLRFLDVDTVETATVKDCTLVKGEVEFDGVKDLVVENVIITESRNDAIELFPPSDYPSNTLFKNVILTRNEGNGLEIATEETSNSTISFESVVSCNNNGWDFELVDADFELGSSIGVVAGFTTCGGGTSLEDAIPCDGAQPGILNLNASPCSSTTRQRMKQSKADTPYEGLYELPSDEGCEFPRTLGSKADPPPDRRRKLRSRRSTKAGRKGPSKYERSLL